MEKHFDSAIDDGVLFAISESGYSNAYLGIEWLKHFDKQPVDGKASIDCLSLMVMGATLRTSSRTTARNTTSFRLYYPLIQRIY